MNAKQRRKRAKQRALNGTPMHARAKQRAIMAQGYAPHRTMQCTANTGRLSRPATMADLLKTERKEAAEVAKRQALMQARRQPLLDRRDDIAAILETTKLEYTSAYYRMRTEYHPRVCGYRTNAYEYAITQPNV